MNDTTTLMTATAKRLLDGGKNLSKLRKQYEGGLHLAIDNDVVMGYVSPKGKNAALVASLLRAQDGFSVHDQEVSLAERVCGYVLFDAASYGDKRVFSLPGHHSELWSSLAGGLHARMTDELTAPGLTQEMSKTIARFREDFYQVAVLGKERLSLEKLVAAVPDQLYGWLGVGTAAQEWERLKYLKVKNVLQTFPKDVVDRSDLSSEGQNAFLMSLIDSRNKWQRRLEEAHKAWIAEGGDAAEHNMVSIPFDAVALSYLEYFNRNTYGLAAQRLMLVTSSDRMFRAVQDVSGSEFGGESNSSASDYILHPFDFLDECHVHLTGDLHPQHDDDKSGRLSTALDMLVNADSRSSAQKAEQEFGEIWGKFLRASVLERVQRINRARSTHLRRVAFVFSQIGISSKNNIDNPLVLELAELGSEMLSEAADIRISSLKPEEFTRGAPLLRLDKHKLAQRVQLRRPQGFCRLLTNGRTRPAIILEAGHRYTLHLLQARAMIWAGDWRTALRLCEFSLAIRDKLPRLDTKRVPDVDGREAIFLAAVCERHARGGNSRALTKARSLLEDFLVLAREACAEGSIPPIDLRLHELRAKSEQEAIDTTLFLSMLLAESNTPNECIAENSELEMALKGLLPKLGDTRRLALDIANDGGGTGDFEIVFLRYMCFRIFQQAWVNELQLRYCAPVRWGLENMGAFERMWSEKEQWGDIRGELRVVRVPDSWFVDTCTRILTCKLGKASKQFRAEAISNLLAANRNGAVFLYDQARNAKFLAAIEDTDYPRQ